MRIIETNLKFSSNRSTMTGKPQAVVLHHAAAENCSVADVHKWHLNNGWAGIGYHFFVNKKGEIYRGRPESWKGAHTDGYNHYLGICAEGNFEKHAMPTEQRQAIVELIRYLNSKYGDLKIYKHKDLDNTACPGKMYPFDEIRVDVNNKTKDIKTEDNTVNLTVRVLGVGDTGEDVKSIQRLIGFTSNNDIDGIFGQNTLAKVKAFQKNNGLEADGVVGTLTWNKLLGG